jgi:hypothetical protein
MRLRRINAKMLAYVSSSLNYKSVRRKNNGY